MTLRKNNSKESTQKANAMRYIATLNPRLRDRASNLIFGKSYKELKKDQ